MRPNSENCRCLPTSRLFSKKSRNPGPCPPGFSISFPVNDRASLRHRQTGAYLPDIAFSLNPFVHVPDPTLPYYCSSRWRISIFPPFTLLEVYIADVHSVYIDRLWIVALLAPRFRLLWFDIVPLLAILPLKSPWSMPSSYAKKWSPGRSGLLAVFYIFFSEKRRSK